MEERVFDDSLDQSGASAEHSGIVGTNGRSVELRPRGSGGQSSRSIRRQTWNRDDVSRSFDIKQHSAVRQSAWHRGIEEFELSLIFSFKSVFQVWRNIGI